MVHDTRFQGLHISALALLLVVCTLSSPLAADTRSKLDPLLRVRAQALTGRSRVIVEFEPGTEGVVRSPGAVTGRTLPSSLSQVIDVDNQALPALAADPRVRRVVEDRPAFATLERTGQAIGATAVREDLGLTGEGVGVAIIDSGITPWHNDIEVRGRSRRGAVVHFKDFTATEHRRVWVPEAPSDEYGHGTHVAGIIAGSGHDSDGKRQGVAPGVSLVVLKVLDGQGHGHISDVIAAIDYAIAVKDRFNIRVINLSVASAVSESYHTDPLAQAARRAVNAGLVFVASAGNLGQDANGQLQHGGITSPANAPWVLTVGAASHQGTVARDDDRVAAFSSQGPTWIDFAAKPDILAYGVGIESLAAPNSTLVSTYADYLLGGTRRGNGYAPYLSMSGTSMAAPVVAGTVALMLQANPALTPNGVKAILEYTAESRQSDPLVEGAGLLNARGAVRLARRFARPQEELGAPGDMVAGRWTAWSQQVLWGNHMLEGTLPPADSHAWNTAIDWGASATSTGTPIWGTRADDDNIVWSTYNDDNIVWSTYNDDNIVWSTARDDDNIVWSTALDDNIVWSTYNDDNIVWSTRAVTNVVWGSDCGGANCRGVVWGAHAPNGSVWGTARDDDNIVWSTYSDDNIVWSTYNDDNIVWSTYNDDNIVWSTAVPAPVLWPSTPAILPSRTRRTSGSR